MSATPALPGHDTPALAPLPGIPPCPLSDEIALVSGASSLTYRELAIRVHALSSFLRTHGVGPGVHVGVALNRSIELIAAILSVVEAGGAYVPLDPSYPQARLDHMVATSGLKCILTLRAHTGLFPNTDCVALDEFEVNSVSGDMPPAANGNDPLYAIFTSGSTGQPKAASVFRRGFSNLVAWYAKELSLGPDDRSLVISSPSFDLTQKNFFAPLVTGGRMILDDCQTYDISRISKLIRDHGVTLVNCTPSAFYPLVDAAAADGYAALATLRWAVLGGEPISIPRLRDWLEHPSCRAEIVNTYGPTECTDICAFHRMHRGNLDAFSFVPLGREVPNVTVTIRDEDLSILPDGELGELCISGAGVGGGYLNDPVRTAERFVQDHTLYKTGDLAKRLPCGTLEFRGRADHQVKVNGFRIELGEIEIVLNRHAAVKEAVVIARDQRLIAHVQNESPVEAAALREHLATALPAYMIPGEFHFVSVFPLTPNGKVDRLALVNNGHAVASTPIAPASDPHEARILSIWSEVLECPVSDPTANFFDLGGTSILLAVVHVKLREATGRDIPITELFARPSARTLAGYLQPQAAPTANSTAQDRARMQQAGMARFRRSTR
ncbi:non-ribosomal peptide synthetase [Luteolibacter ambystomatis]|uniref:Non-ribosomal peptide synthetase n=1 Tax=Luteolibacter ambystomatis TaxID=2824561 RepID=A0A975G6C6_9BACT|nr:non-ribosomal peptide synthetase [Luteolibacter ambystomatis]QUE49613.1 non-ribosomal peptide synthetase [Luteolibacter ambystomatis]